MQRLSSKGRDLSWYVSGIWAGYSSNACDSLGVNYLGENFL
ncbi:hypothetical protein SAMN02982997_02029 [Legionella micdadei]|uniref:Uncharacterized protein n=1 Tax=Legionella micdadei TaxID=451 RepID=A0A1G5GWI9_LEGMI|nr:hypothetical protein SAMN02982997_02029 [Legionella micdadei]